MQDQMKIFQLLRNEQLLEFCIDRKYRHIFNNNGDDEKLSQDQGHGESS